MKVFAGYFPSFYLFLNGTVYCVIAWLFGSNPDVWYGAVEIQLLSSTGFTELNSIYVGMLAGAGVFLLVAAMSDSLRLGATLFMLCSYTGLALVRGWGIFVRQDYNALMMQLFIVESLSVAGTVLALYCLHLNSLRKRSLYY